MTQEFLGGVWEVCAICAINVVEFPASLCSSCNLDYCEDCYEWYEDCICWMERDEC